ncbi:LysR family transcriptional regulator [Aliidiomarina celeris]|uniref:LysR family transcriptional regulator n=1 Tax=Aliidiomarina celeris TaxID=2249428 RepID=UPI000DEC0195|nr:LysR family transcriptional regulator [Aliidiomarina celeris]
MKKAEFPSLNALRVFDTVVRMGSFKRAAAELGVTQSAISRQLATLEQQLGIKLIQRDNRMHDLTPAGQALAPELHRVFRQLERIVTQTRKEGEHARRVITIGISHCLFQYWLLPMLESFRQLYPHLELRIKDVPEYLDSANEDAVISLLERNDIDVVLCLGSSQHKSLLCQQLFSPTYILVGNNRVGKNAGEKSAASNSTTALNELVLVQHQQRPRGLKTHLGLNIERVHFSSSSLMAATIAEQQPTLMLLPNCCNSLLSAHKLTELGRIKCPQPLSVMIRKEDDRELGMVALLQWLEHRVTKMTEG